MRSNPESTMAIVAALFVLFSAMLDPRVSVAIAVVALVVLAVLRARVVEH